MRPPRPPAGQRTPDTGPPDPVAPETNAPDRVVPDRVVADPVVADPDAPDPVAPDRDTTGRGTPAPHSHALHVLVLGGTTEARALAVALDARPGTRVTTSLAGRVTTPAALPGGVRVGGFGGPEGLADWLRAHEVDALVDATHPFAATMSGHAASAAAHTGTPLLVLRRPGWREQPGDRWEWADSTDEAARRLSAYGPRVLLTTGRGSLAAFAAIDTHHFLVRAVEEPRPPTPRHLEILLDRGPYTLEAERALLCEHRVDVLVTKDSGGTATSAKLTAARERGLPVLIVRRPAPPVGVPVTHDVPQALERLARITRPTRGTAGERTAENT